MFRLKLHSHSNNSVLFCHIKSKSTKKSSIHTTRHIQCRKHKEKVKLRTKKMLNYLYLGQHTGKNPQARKNKIKQTFECWFRHLFCFIFFFSFQTPAFCLKNKAANLFFIWKPFASPNVLLTIKMRMRNLSYQSVHTYDVQQEGSILTKGL